jgi:hypothetical protein
MKIEMAAARNSVRDYKSNEVPSRNNNGCFLSWSYISNVNIFISLPLVRNLLKKYANRIFLC